MALPSRMKFGIFMAPFHPVGDNPTLALERDLELIELLEHLGYDEAWIGEHHSAGWEIISSPEVFISAAAQRTQRIKLGTGVISLPYHHPLMTVNRMVQLDHMTRGRVMMGVGPGALVTDAYMMGIDFSTQRPRMDEGLGIIIRLLTETEPITYESDWFVLRDARLHLRPYTQPYFPIAVAAAATPSGLILAGKHGTAVLSLSVLASDAIRTTLKDFWKIAEDTAEEHGNTMNREDWRLVLHVFLAETRKEAFEQARVKAGHYQRELFRGGAGQSVGVRRPPRQAHRRDGGQGRLVRWHARRPCRDHPQAGRGERRVRRTADTGGGVGYAGAGLPQLRAAGQVRHAPVPGIDGEPD